MHCPSEIIVEWSQQLRWTPTDK